MAFPKLHLSDLGTSVPRYLGRRGQIARFASVLTIVASTIFVRSSLADLHYIENLKFADPSPGGPRANSVAPARRSDAYDTSFAVAAGWAGGFESWQQQFDHSKQLVAIHPATGLVLIGDSLTQNWGNVGGRLVNGAGAGTWNSARFNFDQYGALNLGLSGDQTQNLIYRINHGQLNEISPGLVVLMIGTNNLYAPTGNPGFPIDDYVGPPHTAEEVANGVLASAQVIHAKLPHAHLLVLGILRGLDDRDPDRIAANKVNRLLADAFAKDTNPLFHFLDISHRFRKSDGSVNELMGNDGVHLTVAGYEAWAEEIAPCVSRFAKVIAKPEPVSQSHAADGYTLVPPDSGERASHN